MTTNWTTEVAPEDEAWDEVYDDYPAPTEAEMAYSRRLGEVYDRYDRDGGSFEAAIVACGYCPDLVQMRDSEGYPIDGRCLAPIDDVEMGACEGHADERRGWMAASEAERIAWEMTVADR